MINLESHSTEFVEDDQSDRPSKSELKRRSAVLHDLGGELLRLAPHQINQMGLPNELLEALLMGQSMKRDGAYARQRKYIGKLLRRVDPAPIREKISAIAQIGASANRSLHQIEAWRDRLIAEGDPALAEFMADFPLAERTKLRRLIETAQRERRQQLAPRASRLIFKYVRSLIDVQ